MQETRPANVSSGTPVRHPSDTPETVRKPKLLDRLPEALCSRHTFGHSSATHLLEDEYDMRMVQELPGHEDVNTTMLYAHLFNQGEGVA